MLDDILDIPHVVGMGYGDRLTVFWKEKRIAWEEYSGSVHRHAIDRGTVGSKNGNV